jgi:hypothetical protein
LAHATARANTPIQSGWAPVTDSLPAMPDRRRPVASGQRILFCAKDVGTSASKADRIRDRTIRIVDVFRDQKVSGGARWRIRTTDPRRVKPEPD